MKTRYKSIFGILTLLLLVASFVVPAKLASTEPVSAGTMEWTKVSTPDSAVPGSYVYSPVVGPFATGQQYLEGGSEIIKVVVGNNGASMFAIVKSMDACGYVEMKLLKSMNGGVGGWMGSAMDALVRDYSKANAATWNLCCDKVWVQDVAIAPDDPNMLIVAVAQNDAPWTQQVWITTDSGTWWADTGWAKNGVENEIISTMDISMDSGVGRYLLVGVRDQVNDSNDLQTLRVPGFGSWVPQSTGFPAGDVYDANFSTTFIGDSTIVVVYANGAPVVAPATYLFTGAHDLFTNVTTWDGGTGVELQVNGVGLSPGIGGLINADIELPSDFSGQMASQRRFYVSTSTFDAASDSGIFRVDDTTPYLLMDTTGQDCKQIWSIAYWGTYASGKLLAGEIFGYPCTATVPVWFTDSPTLCASVCWYPCKKCPSGAAGCYVWDGCFACTDTYNPTTCACTGTSCTSNLAALAAVPAGKDYAAIACGKAERNYGNAYVLWSPTYADQGVAYAATSSVPWGSVWSLTTSPCGVPWPDMDAIDCSAFTIAQGTWPAALIAYPVPLDETAFSLTRNNGETWNQISLIDTRMSKLTDVAVAPDCTTMYLASTNNSTCNVTAGCATLPEPICSGFDSVWRSSMNEAVVSPPIAAAPLGTTWERVLWHVTAPTCADQQSEYAILRLAQDKNDGQVVFWGAGGANGEDFYKCAGDLQFITNANTNAIEWSPDFGEYWGDIRPRVTVQDMAAPTSSTLYVLAANATVQKLPYTGTAWSSASATVGLPGPFSHTIEAVGDNVLVGMSAGPGVAYSPNAGAAFMPVGAGDPPPAPYGNVHAIFDTDFATNQTIYAGTDPATGRISRNKIGPTPWTDMMYMFPGAHMVGYYGLVQTNSNNVMKMGTLYGAHAPVDPCNAIVTAGDDSPTWSGVERTLIPLGGVPKPGVPWSCLDASEFLYQLNAPPVWFTLEPESLKMCGCLTQDTNATLYAIDNDWYAGYTNAQLFGYLTPPPPPPGVPNVGTGSKGMLWEYTDCMAKNAPALTMEDGAIIGCDPATGRNQEVNFTWEQLCIATEYDLQIFKDEAKTLAVYDGPNFRPTSVTSPTLVYLSGGEGIGGASYSDLDFATPSLECGHTYYWRVHVTDEATADAVDSPWSETRKFTIKAGFRVTTPYYGPQLLAPDNGCGCACSAPVNFSWSPFKETTGYKFELSENADMSSPVVSTTVKGTAYAWATGAKCNTSYFWRVMAVEPAPSEWSATFSFITQAAPAAPPAPEPEPGTPFWVWVVIAIGAILVIVTLVLIFKTRRV